MFCPQCGQQETLSMRMLLITTTCNVTAKTGGSLEARLWLKTATAQTYFADNAGLAVKEVSFNNIYVKQQASLVADQYISDVFFGTVDGSSTFTNSLAITSGDYKKKLMFNSYTVSLASAWTNLHISYSVFWTGTSG